jgi:TatD DNase family protein
MPSGLSWPPPPEPLPVPVADSHCHLDIDRSADGPPRSVADSLAMAASVGVERVVHIGCDPTSIGWAAGAPSEHAGLVAGVGVHPNEAPELVRRDALEAALAEVERLASASQVRAVGETGLDYFRTGADGHPAQHDAFRAHIALARRLGKTLVIHDRDAHADVLRLLDEQPLPERVVMHCFSGDTDFARQCLERGCYLSFAGTVTFKNAGQLRDALGVTPLDRLLVETDAPFLTPTPYRGRPNASYLLPVTVRAMAEVRRDDLAELCAALATNTATAFGGAW